MLARSRTRGQLPSEALEPILQMLPPHRMATVRLEFPDDPDQLERIRMDGEGPGVKQHVAVRTKAQDVVWLVRAVVGPAPQSQLSDRHHQ